MTLRGLYIPMVLKCPKCTKELEHQVIVDLTVGLRRQELLEVLVICDVDEGGCGLTRSSFIESAKMTIVEAL